MIGRHSLQAANCDGLSIHSAAPAGGLARSVARPAQDARKHVRLSIEEIGLRVAPLRNQSDVLGNVGVSRAGPLAVYDFMVVPRVCDVCGHFGRWRYMDDRPGTALKQGRVLFIP